MKVNEEDPYPHFLHQFPVSNLTTVSMDGDISIYYIGFGTLGIKKYFFLMFPLFCL